VRAICADERLIYLAEAPLRAQYASHASTQHAGRLSAREPRSGRVSRTLSGAGGHAISCLLATSDGHLWSGSFDGLVRVSRRGGQALHEARAHSSTVHALAEACVSSTAATVFSAGSDFLIRAWSLSLAPLRTMRAHTCPVHSLAAFAAPAASAAGASGVHEVWSGGDDHVIHIWSASEASGFAHVASLDDFGAPIRVLATQLSAAAATSESRHPSARAPRAAVQVPMKRNPGVNACVNARTPRPPRQPQTRVAGDSTSRSRAQPLASIDACSDVEKAQTAQRLMCAVC
jgi:hypothetical protein